MIDLFEKLQYIKTNDCLQAFDTGADLDGDLSSGEKTFKNYRGARREL